MGDPIRIGPPALLPVTLAELKAQCRVTSDDEDALMVGYLRAAVGHVEQYTGLSLIAQTWFQTFDAFASSMILRRRPLIEVISIGYFDADSASQVVGGSIYSVIGVGADMVPGSVVPASGQSWPTPLVAASAITITYRAGFGETQNDVPELIRHAVLLTAATWFNYREDLVPDRVSEVPGASKSLLREWRPLAVA